MNKESKHMAIDIVKLLSYLLLLANIVIGTMLIIHPLRMLLNYDIRIGLTKFYLYYMIILGIVSIGLYIFIGLWTISVLVNPGVFGATVVRGLITASLGLNAMWAVAMNRANGYAKKTEAHGE